MELSFQTRRCTTSDNAKYATENMVYGNVKYFKEWISTVSGVLLRKKNFVSVAWVMIITQKTAKEEENVE